MSVIGRTRSTTFLLFTLLTLLLVLGCESLPNVKNLVEGRDFAPAPPRIWNGSGTLSLKASHAVISRLRQEAGATEILRSHIAVVEAISGQPLIAGNRVDLLSDGPDTFAAMGEAIRKATNHINLETFIFRDDEVGSSLADLLITKRRQGVRVNVMYDSFGGMRTPGAFFDRMRMNGVNVLEFNPISAAIAGEGWGINNRDHRKILVVDGRVAFTGGLNFYRGYSQKPSYRPQRKEEQPLEHYWRDMHVRIEGPAVAEFQRLFIKMWIFQRGPDLGDADYFPSLQEVGDSLVQVIASSPDQPIPNIYATYFSAVRHAAHSIHLTHAYLVLDEGMLKALVAAARDGVDVRIIVPSFSDFWLPFYAARRNYSELLSAGVRIFEREGAMLHSKTAVIDGVWSTVGSSNLDLRSFMHDAESNAVILGRQFGALMEDVFEKDMEASREVSLEDWHDRPLADKAKERIARLFKYWL